MKNSKDIGLYIGIVSYVIGIVMIVAFLLIITTSLNTRVLIITVIGSIIASMFLCAIGEALITYSKNKKKKK